MINLSGRMVVRPEAREAFIAGVKAVTPPSLRDPGCRTYSCYEDVNEPNSFLFYEEWDSEAELDAHLAAPHTQAFIKVVGASVAKPATITVHTILESHTK